MNHLSKITKIALLSGVSIFLFGIYGAVSADIIYDPDTNSYINTADDTMLTESDGDAIWIPIDDTGNEIATPVVEEPTPEPAGIVEEVEVEITDTEDTDPFIQEVVNALEQTEPVEPVQIEVDPLADVEPVAVVAEETASIIQIDTTTTDTSAGFNFQTASLADLNALKNENREMLLAYLEEKFENTADVYARTISLQYGSSIADLVQCVGYDTTISQIQKEMDVIAADLKTRILEDSTKFHGEISSLKNRFDLGLISETARDAEGGALATLIDTSTQNYIGLVDYYVSQVTEQVQEFVNSQEADTIQNMGRAYTARTTLLDQLKQSFGHFENSSFINQTVIGPRADELKVLAAASFQVFVNDMKTRRGDRSKSEFETMVDAMRNTYDAYVEDQISKLFPHEEIVDIYKSYDLVADIYDIGAESYNCEQIATNRNIEEIAPQLLSKIERVQQDIAVSNSGSATSRSDIQKNLTDTLLVYYDNALESIFQSAYSTATVITQAPILVNQDSDIVGMVVTYLNELKVAYTASDDLRGFEAKLERANGKIEVILEAGGITDRLVTILEAIRTAIVQVLAG